MITQIVFIIIAGRLNPFSITEGTSVGCMGCCAATNSMTRSIGTSARCSARGGTACTALLENRNPSNSKIYLYIWHGESYVLAIDLKISHERGRIFMQNYEHGPGDTRSTRGQEEPSTRLILKIQARIRHCQPFSDDTDSYSGMTRIRHHSSTEPCTIRGVLITSLTSIRENYHNNFTNQGRKLR